MPEPTSTTSTSSRAAAAARTESSMFWNGPRVPAYITVHRSRRPIRARADGVAATGRNSDSSAQFSTVRTRPGSAPRLITRSRMAGAITAIDAASR